MVGALPVPPGAGSVGSFGSGGSSPSFMFASYRGCIGVHSVCIWRKQGFKKGEKMGVSRALSGRLAYGRSGPQRASAVLGFYFGPAVSPPKAADCAAAVVRRNSRAISDSFVGFGGSKGNPIVCIHGGIRTTGRRWPRPPQTSGGGLLKPSGSRGLAAPFRWAFRASSIRRKSLGSTAGSFL